MNNCFTTETQRRRGRKGFTLIELLVVIPLFGLLMILAFAELRSAARSSGRATRGAAEAILAAEFSERFRNDVRAAQRVEIGPAGDSVKLLAASAVVEYWINDSGRLQRVEEDVGLTGTGPALRTARFALAEGKGLRLLRACWVCAADVDDDPSADVAARNAGKVLILDTAVRANDAGGRP